MSKLLRLAAVVLCLGVLALGVAAFGPACLPTSSPPGDVDKRPSPAEGVALRERLNQQQGAIHRRDEAKRHLAEEVIARRRSLGLPKGFVLGGTGGVGWASMTRPARHHQNPLRTLVRNFEGISLTGRIEQVQYDGLEITHKEHFPT
jgi:hypothetical protein